MFWKFLFLFSILWIQFCQLLARTEFRPITKNYYSYPEDEIQFGRLALPKFKYSVSSCILPDYCAHNLFDSNSNTEWTSIKDSTEEWVIIDFGTKRLMNGLYMEVSTLSDPIAEFEIQVQHRGEWKGLKKYYYPKGKNYYSIGNIDASILRIYFPKATASTIIISDLQVQLNNSILTGLSSRLTGYAYPIENGILPDDDYSLPGAPRKYRNGVHKGLDISYKQNDRGEKISLSKSTPILSIGNGTVVRVDKNYQPMTLTEYNEITEYNQTHPVTYVDRDFGGMQVWIDHGNGVMSSYNHMSSISSQIQVGYLVKKGEKIGTVGNSGLKAEANGTEEQIHLHLEIWIDGEFLGNDLNPAQSKKLLQLFFSG